MELFLLFSLALTFVSFLSIVLAEPPSPLVQSIQDTDSVISIGNRAPSVSNDSETGIGGFRNSIDELLESSEMQSAMEEFPVAVL